MADTYFFRFPELAVDTLPASLNHHVVADVKNHIKDLYENEGGDSAIGQGKLFYIKGDSQNQNVVQTVAIITRYNAGGAGVDEHTFHLRDMSEAFQISA